VQGVSRCSSCELARIQVHRGREGGHISRRNGQLITHILLSTYIQDKDLLSLLMLPIAGDRCPYCGSRNVCVSRPTNIWEELAILLTLRPVRCLEHSHRFQRSLFIKTPMLPEQDTTTAESEFATGDVERRTGPRNI
jgi:hypothetical protein